MAVACSLRPKNTHALHKFYLSCSTKEIAPAGDLFLFVLRRVIPPTAVGGSFQILSTNLSRTPGNPTHGSGWFGSDPFYGPSPEFNVIPPTAVGGYFRSLLEKNLNNPPTTVGGIPLCWPGDVERI